MNKSVQPVEATSSPGRRAMWPVLAAAVVGSSALGSFALADTVAGLGAAYNWTVALPLAPAPGSTVTVDMLALDADNPAEGAMHVGTSYVLPLWGAQGVPANDAAPPTSSPPRNVTYPTPASAWVVGTNPVIFTWTGQQLLLYHNVLSLSVTYTPTARGDSAFIAYMKAVEASGMVPNWIDPGDSFFLIQREDTDPARTYACAKDFQTGAQAARWTSVDLLAQMVPNAAAPPPTTACDLNWCFASGAENLPVVADRRSRKIAAACP